MKTAMKTMSVKLDENIISEIKKISSIFEISYSDFIRNAVEKAIAEKQKDFMYRMNNVPYATEEEAEEIISALSELSDEDLQVARREKIKL